jgi:hypothetical protein
MTRVKFTFWDFLVGGVFLIVSLSQGGVAMLLAVIAFLVYTLVRIQLASAAKDAIPPSLSGYVPVPDQADEVTVSDDEESIQKQLVDARAEEQNAFAEFRRYATPYYDESWADAMEKVKRLEDKISKREAR